MQLCYTIPLIIAGLVVTPPPAGQGAQGGLKAETLTLEAGDHNLDQLIDKTAKFLGRNYIIHAVQRVRPDQQTIHLQRRLELGIEACEEVVNQLLYTRGWVLTPLDTARGIYEWIYRQSDSTEILLRSLQLTPDEVLARPNLGMHVTTSVALKHLNPAIAAQTLSNLLRDQRNMNRFLPMSYHNQGPVAQPSGGTVVVSGMSWVAAKAVRILRESDRERTGAANDLSGRVHTLEQQMRHREHEAKQRKRGQPPRPGKK